MLVSRRFCAMGLRHSTQRGDAQATSSKGATSTASGVDFADRCVGTLVWKACGDALGAAVEGMDASRIEEKHPKGITAYIKTARGYGAYTDDTQMALALARSIASMGRVDPGHAAFCYAEDFDPYRGYGGTAVKILHSLKNEGADWRTIATHFIPAGSYANGGAMRIAPVGLVYRHARAPRLRHAVTDALLCTHVHPVGIDGAVVQASAVAWLCQQPSPTLPMPPEEQAAFLGALLSYLQGVAATEGMRTKLQRLQQRVVELYSPPRAGEVSARATAGGPGAAALPSPPHNAQRPDPAPFNTAPTVEGRVGSAAGKGQLGDQLAARWARYLPSPEWKTELGVASELAGGEFQIRADDAVAVTLCGFVHHGLATLPASAVVAAVHYGGDTDTTAAMAGALLGALYGTRHLPPSWWDHLENGIRGRDTMVDTAKLLSQLDVRD